MLSSRDFCLHVALKSHGNTMQSIQTILEYDLPCCLLIVFWKKLSVNLRASLWLVTLVLSAVIKKNSNDDEILVVCY